MHSSTNTDQFFTAIAQLYGKPGRQWLKSLPEHVAHCAQQWHLTDLVVGNYLSYNYIVMARRTTDNTPVVIKLGYDADALAQEHQALEIYNGNGCVRLLATDTTRNALLLEQLVPGNSMASLFPQDDDRAIEHTVRIMQQLHAVPLPQATTLPTIADWLTTLQHDNREINGYHLDKARGLAQQLLESSAPPVVLHGDLHQGNILAHDAAWRAIDPKGVIGEPAYEIGTFIRNPTQQLIEHEHATAIMTNRLSRCAGLMNIDRERIKAWSYVQAILAAFWRSEDRQDIDDILRMAELIDQS